MRYGDDFGVNPNFGYVGPNYHTNSCSRISSFESRASVQICKPCYASAFSPTLLKYGVLSSRLSYLSFFGSKGDNKGLEAPEALGIGGAGVGVDDGGIVGSSEWVEKLKDSWQTVVHVAYVAGQKAKEVSDGLTLYAEQILDSHPYFKDVLVPVGGTFLAALLAWMVLPSVLKRLHKYSSQSSAVLLARTGSIFGAEIPYEKSVWGAMEDPVRYLVTFIAFSEICFLLAPDDVASQLIGQVWRGAAVLSFVWFVQRWKANFFSHALAAENILPRDQERLLTLDSLSTVGLLAVGIMALAEACGVAVQSILTVGGIGGVATAFASKDILGNVLSGLSMQFTKPFSLGDTIKAGSIEGQVVDMGLTTTSLLNAEKFPVIVPNSMFSSQVIVNKSRAGWRAFNSSIPLRLETLEKVPEISTDIKSMLQSYPKVFLGREAPYCYLSRIESKYAELTLGCNLKQLSKSERDSTEQDILLQCVKIIKQHGASLGSA